MHQAFFSFLFFLSVISTKVLGSYAYVANMGDNSISVIDTNTNQVINLITSSNISQPVALALSKDKKFLFATYKGNGVAGYSKIDLTTNIVKAFVSAPEISFSAISLSPTESYVYMVDNDRHDFVRFDNPSGTQSGKTRMAYESDVKSILITKDGGVAYLPQGAYGEKGALGVVDLSSMTINSYITLPTSPFAAFNPSQTIIYTGYEGFYTYSIKKNQLIRLLKGNFEASGSIAIDQRGALGFVANPESNSVSVINLLTNQLVKTITHSSFNGPLYIAISLDNKTAYVGNSLGSSISLIDIKSLSVNPVSLNVGNNPQQIVLESPFSQIREYNTLSNVAPFAFQKGVR